MLVVPVLDLLGGCVVRGVAGRRETYRPIESPLAPNAEPATIAEALRDRFGLSTLYLADLDAIAGRAPHDSAVDDLLRRGFTLWIDAGVRRGSDAARLLARHAGHASPAGSDSSREEQVHVVAGLETLAGPAALGEVAAVAGTARTIFSLDLKAGELLTAPGASWGVNRAAGCDDEASQGPGRPRSDETSGNTEHPEIVATGSSPNAALIVAAQAIATGVRRVLALDLARVGVGTGVGTEPLCRRLVQTYPDAEIIAGGGVRSRRDLEQLADAGCRAALVASALHFGPLTRDDIERLQTRR